MPSSNQVTQALSGWERNLCSKFERRRWCELAGAHGATGAERGQALEGWSPPQPVTQHLWAKKQSAAPLLHLHSGLRCRHGVRV